MSENLGKSKKRCEHQDLNGSVKLDRPTIGVTETPRACLIWGARVAWPIGQAVASLSPAPMAPPLMFDFIDQNKPSEIEIVFHLVVQMHIHTLL
jgi:hypothetical protein